MLFYEIIEIRSAKDLKTNYKNLAPLLDDIKDTRRQYRKTLN